uniref:Uncharacterized protein n=1 Tax=Arundo donax TaxID=35708 RepID=A0A0A9G7X7_ARUDO
MLSQLRSSYLDNLLPRTFPASDVSFWLELLYHNFNQNCEDAQLSVLL